MLGSEQLSLAVQVAAVVAPVAVYFLLLGLLNSQPNPQIISARSDFILLNAAFFPVFCVPVLSYFAPSVWTLLVVVGALLASVLLLAPRRTGNWVVYNITLPATVRAGQRALNLMGEPFVRRGRRLILNRIDVTLRFTSMPLLRNVSISTEGANAAEFSRDFEKLLASQLATVPTTATPMAVTFLLIATVMLIAPLGLLADRMPEMVRLVTNLIP